MLYDDAEGLQPERNQLLVQRTFITEEGKEAVHYTCFLRLEISMKGIGSRTVVLHLDSNEMEPECSDVPWFRRKWRKKMAYEINWPKFDDCSKICVYEMRLTPPGDSRHAFTPETLKEFLASVVDPFDISDGENLPQENEYETDKSLRMSDLGKLGRSASMRSHGSHLSAQKKRRRVHEPSDGN